MYVAWRPVSKKLKLQPLQKASITQSFVFDHESWLHSRRTVRRERPDLAVISSTVNSKLKLFVLCLASAYTRKGGQLSNHVAIESVFFACIALAGFVVFFNFFKVFGGKWNDFTD